MKKHIEDFLLEEDFGSEFKLETLNEQTPKDYNENYSNMMINESLGY